MVAGQRELSDGEAWSASEGAMRRALGSTLVGHARLCHKRACHARAPERLADEDTQIGLDTSHGQDCPTLCRSYSYPKAKAT